MMKYILKESELRSMIGKIVAEELNEGVLHALGNVAKTAALATLAPGVLAQKAFVKTNDILNGPETITGAVKDFVGADKANDRREKHMKSLESEERIAKKYGWAKTIPSALSNKERLAPKVLFNPAEFGNLGRHYEEDGNAPIWNQKLNTATQNLRANPNLGRRLARQLRGWLEDRDMEYERIYKH